MKVLTAAELDAERLMIEAAQRDPRRFADLYERYFTRVYAFALAYTQNRSEAEDVTGEAWARANRNLPRFQWRGVPFAAWLFQITANAAADERRRRGRETTLQDLEDGQGERWDSRLAAVEDRAYLFELVDRLPLDQRQILMLRFGQEMRSREIARLLGRSEGAVKQLQYRALKSLRTWVAAHHD